MLLAATRGGPAWFVKFGTDSAITGYGRSVLGADVAVPFDEAQDGAQFWTLARDPFLRDDPFSEQILDRPAYRAQRIAYPWLAAPWRLGGEQALLWGLVVDECGRAHARHVVHRAAGATTRWPRRDRLRVRAQPRGDRGADARSLRDRRPVRIGGHRLVRAARSLGHGDRRGRRGRAWRRTRPGLSWSPWRSGASGRRVAPAPAARGDPGAVRGRVGALCAQSVRGRRMARRGVHRDPVPGLPRRVATGVAASAPLGRSACGRRSAWWRAWPLSSASSVAEPSNCGRRCRTR